MRTRTVLYAVIIALVSAVMAYALATRRAEAVSVIHDRNPLYVRLADGSLRNAYAIRILNKSLNSETFVVKVIGLPDAEVDVIGSSAFSGADPLIEVGPDQSREVRVLVTARGRLAPGGFGPADLHYHTRRGRTRGERQRSFLRTMRHGMSEQSLADEQR